MIGELTAQIKGCYRARRWYDLAIEAKNEDTEVGGALQYTALDRILSLEADIARIKVGSTASLIVPVGEYTVPPYREEETYHGGGPGAFMLSPVVVAPLISRDEVRREPTRVAESGTPGNTNTDKRWRFEPTPPPRSSTSGITP